MKFGYLNSSFSASGDKFHGRTMNFMTYLPETATSSNLSGNASNGTNTDWLAGCDLVPLSLPLPAPRSAFDECFVLEDLGIVRSQWQNDTSFVPTSITYALTFALGVLGNVLVVFALVGDRKGRNVTTSFLVSLAAADLVFLLICVPYEMVAKLTSYWKGGRVLCKIAGFAEMLSACASVLNLTAVTVERYVVIVHPMKSRSWCTMGNTKKIIIGVWIIALLLAAPLLYVMDIETLIYHNPHDFHIISTCADINLVSNGDRLVLAWYQLGAMFLLPTLVMVYCYAIVIHVLWVSTKELARMTHTPRAVGEGRSRLPSGSSLGRGSSGGGHAKGHVAFRDTPAVRDHSAEVREARKQVIKMLLTIIGIFLLCWGPKLIVNILKKHQLATLHSGSAFYLTLSINLLPYLQSCSNPLIYSFMSNNFRRSLRLSCRSVCKFDPYDCCHRDPRHEYEMESKSANGSYTMHSRVSPSMTSRNKRMGTASTYTTMSTDA